MDLNNLKIGQKLYSAINGEVTFMGYIKDPEGNPCLICVKKDNQFEYYFLNGKSNEEGMIILFLTAPVTSSAYYTGSDNDIDKPTENTSIEKIAEIISIYNEILNSGYFTEEMLSDNNLMAKEIWQKMQ